jgi:hypothetical protein
MGPGAAPRGIKGGILPPQPPTGGQCPLVLPGPARGLHSVQTSGRIPVKGLELLAGFEVGAPISFANY